MGFPTGIPAEVALLLAGAYAVHSLPELALALALVTIADVAGATSLHLMIRTGGVRLVERVSRRHEARREDVMERWRRRFGGRETVVVFVVRLLPLVRTYIVIGTALLRIKFRRFLFGAAPAAFIWAGTPLVLGYLFRADVHAFETSYTRFSHLLLLATPLVGVVSSVVWWIHRGGSRWARVYRGRSVIGALVAGASVLVVAKLVWTYDHAVDQHLPALPYPMLLARLAILGTLAVALFIVAFADLRAAGLVRARARRAPVSHLLMIELVSTLVWMGLLGLVAIVATGAALRLPTL